MDICNKHHSQYNVLLQDRAQLTDFLEVGAYTIFCTSWLQVFWDFEAKAE